MAKPGLTVLADHATNPRTEVVHTQHTALNLAGVVDAVRLPVAAFRAPFWAPVALTDEHVLGVEDLETRAVRIPIWPRVVGPAFEAPVILGCLGFGLFGSLSFDGKRTERDDARIE